MDNNRLKKCVAVRNVLRDVFKDLRILKKKADF